jgi:hypothetical protein
MLAAPKIRTLRGQRQEKRMINPRLQARVAGLLYLFVVVASIFALVATSKLIVGGDAAATARNIAASESMFRLAFAANLLAAVAHTAVVAILFSVFRPVNTTVSAVAAFIGLAGCASSAAFMLNQLAALAALDPGNTLSTLGNDQTQAMALHALRLGGLGNSISLVFFGFYCLLLGWLVLGSTFVPRIFGVFLIIAGAGWLIGNLTLFVAPGVGRPLSRFLLPVSGLGEFLFTLWLLAMGVNAAKWKEQAGATPAG